MLKRILAAIFVLACVSSVYAGDYGYTQPFLNITGTNQIDGISVNPNTAGAGNFTTLAASSTVSGTGFSTYLASPPAIGGTVAAAGTFTTLTSTTLTNDSVLQINGLETPLQPGGRVTLSSTLPVLTSDTTAATTIYYLPYINQLVPIYNGTHWTEQNIGASGLNFALGATNMPTTEVFDIYVVNVSGTPTLCSMYWGSNTSRSTSAAGKTGTANASITQLNGVWVNNAAIATGNCFGGASGTTSVTIPLNQGTLLGTYLTSAGGQTQFVCKPAGASGGTALTVYISNAYNRVNVSCSNSDTATAQTSASSSWAKLGANDTAAWVDSLQVVSVSYDAHVVAGNGTAAGDCGSFGVTLGGTGTTAPNVFATTCAPTATLADNYQTLAVHEGFYPVLGLSSTLFAEKQSATGTTTYMPTASGENFSVNLAY